MRRGPAGIYPVGLGEHLADDVQAAARRFVSIPGARRPDRSRFLEARLWPNAHAPTHVVLSVINTREKP